MAKPKTKGFSIKLGLSRCKGNGKLKIYEAPDKLNWEVELTVVPKGSSESRSNICQYCKKLVYCV